VISKRLIAYSEVGWLPAPLVSAAGTVSGSNAQHSRQRRNRKDRRCWQRLEFVELEGNQRSMKMAHVYPSSLAQPSAIADEVKQ
jgi:hypothetical protein